MPYEILEIPDGLDVEEEAPPSSKKKTFEIVALPRTSTRSDAQDSSEEDGSRAQALSGIAHGITDIYALPALAMGLLQSPINMILGAPTEETGLLPGAKERENLAHQASGRYNEGNPSLADIMAMGSEDDFLPAGFSGSPMNNYAALQNALPEETHTLAEEIPRRIIRSLPFAAGGINALLPVLSAEGRGLIGQQAGLAAGLPNWMTQALDLGGSLTQGISMSPAKAIENVAEEIPYIARPPSKLARIESHAPKETIAKRLDFLSEKTVPKLENIIENITDKELKDFGSTNFKDFATHFEKTHADELLHSISPEGGSRQSAWKNISRAVNNAYKAERESFEPRYEYIRAAAKSIELDMDSVINQTLKLKKSLDKVKTSPTGYSEVKRTIDTALKDMGYKAMKESNGKLTNKPVNGDVVLELSQRLNQFVNFENLEPTIKNFIKPVQRAVKGALIDALEEKAPAAARELTSVDKSFTQHAQKYGSSTIHKIRSTELPESLSAEYLKPSNLENLRSVIGENKDAWRVVERQVAQSLSEKSPQEATRLYGELREYLSPQARTAVESLINSKDVRTPTGRRLVMQDKVFDDLSRAVSENSAPKLTLQLMRSPEGRKFVQDSLNISSEGRDLFKILDKTITREIIGDAVQDGKINWKATNKILNSKGDRQILTESIGKRGVDSIEKIETYRDNVQKNLNLLKETNPSMLKNFASVLSSPAKYALVSMLGGAVAGPLGVSAAVASTWGSKYAAKLLTDPKVIAQIKRLGTVKLNPEELEPIALKLNQDLARLMSE